MKKERPTVPLLPGALTVLLAAPLVQAQQSLVFDCGELRLGVPSVVTMP